MSAPHSRLLFTAAALVLIFNLLDAIFTIGYVQLGAAEEANPLMAGALEASPVMFMLVKLSLVSLCVTLLWRLRQRRSAVVGLYGAATAYSMLLAYHIGGLQHVAAHASSM